MAETTPPPLSVDDVTAQAEAGTMPPARAARAIAFLTGDLDRAIGFAQKAYARKPRPRLLEEIGDLHLMKGDGFLARNIYLACLARFGRLAPANLVEADIPLTFALVDDDAQLLYLPLPKCASTTVKNYFASAIDGTTYGEQVHGELPDRYRLVSAEDMATRYCGYHKFTVIRDPVQRVASYFTRNVRQGSVRRTAFDLPAFRDLSTAPSPDAFVARFRAYRRLFLDIRHHCYSLTAHLKPFLHREAGLHVYGMNGLDRIRALIAERFATGVEDERFMVTGGGGTGKGAVDPAVWAPLRKHFEADYRTFADALAPEGGPDTPLCPVLPNQKAPDPLRAYIRDMTQAQMHQRRKARSRPPAAIPRG